MLNLLMVVDWLEVFLIEKHVHESKDKGDACPDKDTGHHELDWCGDHVEDFGECL